MSLEHDRPGPPDDPTKKPKPPLGLPPSKEGEAGTPPAELPVARDWHEFAQNRETYRKSQEVVRELLQLGLKRGDVVLFNGETWELGDAFDREEGRGVNLYKIDPETKATVTKEVSPGDFGRIKKIGKVSETEGEPPAEPEAASAPQAAHREISPEFMKGGVYEVPPEFKSDLPPAAKPDKFGLDLLKRVGGAVGKQAAKAAGGLKEVGKKVAGTLRQTDINLETSVRKEQWRAKEAREAKRLARQQLEQIVVQGIPNEELKRIGLGVGDKIRVYRGKDAKGKDIIDKGWTMGSVFEEAGVKGVRVYKVDPKTGELVQRNASFEALAELNKPRHEKVRESVRAAGQRLAKVGEALKAGARGAKEGYQERRAERIAAKKEKLVPRELSPEDVTKSLQVQGLLSDASYDVGVKEFERGMDILIHAEEVVKSISDKNERKGYLTQIKELEARIKQGRKLAGIEKGPSFQERILGFLKEKLKITKKETKEAAVSVPKRGLLAGLRSRIGAQIEFGRTGAKEAAQIETELKEIPPKEREKVGLGLRNFGFFVQEWKSELMEKVCRGLEPHRVVSKEEEGTLSRFFHSFADTYRRDAEYARKKIEAREKSKTILQRSQNVGYLMGNVFKVGRTVADIVGWTAGSPLRYVMIGAQFFTRGAEAAKEARLINEKVIEKTRIQDIEKAAHEAWRIYEEAQKKAGEGNVVSKENLERAYAENLPQDLLQRLKRWEPGTASNFLVGLGQMVLVSDIELFIERTGKRLPKDLFERRLRELDRMVSQYGTVDALAMAGRYSETAGKAVIAAVQIETMALLIKNLPDIVSKLSASFSDIFGGGGGPEIATAPTMPAETALRVAPPIEVRPPVAVPETVVSPPESIPSPEAQAPVAPEALADTAHVEAPAPHIVPPPEAVTPPETPTDTSRPTITPPPDTTAVPRDTLAGRPGVVPPPELAPTLPAPSGEYVEVAERGDSVWSMAKEQLERHYGPQFSSLNEAQQTYMIDSIKDRIAANPGAFGLTDVDRVEVGQRVDFSSVFSDQTEIQGDITEAQSLTQAAMDNIRHNNVMLQEWVQAHPHERLTSEGVGRILGGEVAPAAETLPQTFETPPSVETEMSEQEITPSVEAAPESAVPPVEITPEVKDIQVPHEALREIQTGPVDYVFETRSGQVEVQFIYRGGNIVDFGHYSLPTNATSTMRLFNPVSHVEAVQNAIAEHRLPSDYGITNGVRQLESDALLIDAKLRARDTLPPDFPNRSMAVNFINNHVTRLIEMSEQTFGDIFKSTRQILRMRYR